MSRDGEAALYAVCVQSVGSVWMPLDTLASEPAVRAQLARTGPKLQRGWRPALLASVIEARQRTHACKTLTLSADRGQVRRTPVPVLLKQQLEYYWATQGTDLYLAMQLDAGGGRLALTELATWPRVQALVRESASADDMALLREAVAASELLQLSDDGTHVQQRSLPERVLRQAELLLGKANMEHDVLLRELMEENQGWVRVGELLEHPTMRLLARPNIRAALALLQARSAVIEVDAPAARCRPRWLAQQPAGSQAANSAPAICGEGEPAQLVAMQLPAPSLVCSWKAASLPERGFTVMTANVLSPTLSQYHTYAREEHRAWPARLAKLLEFVDVARPSVVCLQEVPGTADGTWNGSKDTCAALRELFWNRGYQSVYARKLDSSKNPVQPSSLQLGNLLLYKHDEFAHLQARVLGYASALALHCRHNEAQQKHYTTGGHTAAIVRVQHRASGRVVVLATTHLTPLYTLPEVQLAQVASLLEEVSVLAGPDVPVVIGGDFNTTPLDRSGDMTAVYEYLSTGVVSIQHPQLEANLNATLPFPLLRAPNDSTVTHSLRLCSAYASKLGVEPAFTNKTADFEGTLDYIWLSAEILNVAQVLETPSRDQCVQGIPNADFFSDHVPLLAEMHFSN